MATIVRYLTFATVMTGCGFDSPDGLPEIIPPAPMPTTQPCGTNDPGVVLCLDFEDPSLAAQALDSSPNGNHATAHDVDLTDRTPPGEQAAQMTAISSLKVRESAALDLTKLTIEMWIRPELTKRKGDKDVGLFDNYGHYTMRFREDFKVRCGIGVDAAFRVSSQSAVPQQGWSHVACTYDSGEMRVYINGQLSDCQDLGTTIPGGDLGSAIGSEILLGAASIIATKDPFLGGIDNVRVYDHAREAAQICAAAGHTGTCASECPTSEGAGD